MLLADDTKSFQEINREVSQQAEDQKSLQSRIDRIAQWAKDWKMEIHPAKSKILHIGKENPGLPYWLNGSEIPTVAMEEDIGLWMLEDLLTKTHVQKAKGRALAEIIRIQRNFLLIDVG